jgi:hypothetical protein
VTLLGATTSGALLFSVSPGRGLPDEIWRSSDGGRTGTRVLQLTTPQQVTGFTFGATTDTVLIAGRSLTTGDGLYGSLYRSEDGGQSFDAGQHGGPQYRCLAYGGGQLYACAENIYLESAFALGVSSDWGNRTNR